MQTAVVFFGGKSCEHDISIITGLQIMASMDKTKYKIVPVYITRDGIWLTGDKLFKAKSFQEFNTRGTRVCFLEPNQNRLLIKNVLIGSSVDADVAILCMHGINGEDGSLQGMLTLSNIPYTSSGVLGSSTTMDKIVMKGLFKAAGVASVPYVWLYSSEFTNMPELVIERVEAKLKYPVMVKPSNLGSSIGISRCENREELKLGLEVAQKYDNRILVEQALVAFREINVSCLGSGGEFETSVCEEPIGFKNILSFNDKYISSKSDSGVKRIMPADIPGKIETQIRKMAVRACSLMDCSGVVRVDFLIDTATNKLYINEINSIPGSLSLHMWRQSGVSLGELIDTLVALAIKKHSAEKSLSYAYTSAALFNFGNNSKMNK